MTLEHSFYTDTPNAEQHPPPANLALVAEDVVEGLRIALAMVEQQNPTNPEAPERSLTNKNLNDSTSLLLRFLDSLPQIGHIPTIEIGGRDVQAHRLGKLLSGEYALFDGPARLSAGQTYPINYWRRHSVPSEFTHQDVLPGFVYETQLYLGYAPPEVTDMDGYAISLNHFLELDSSSDAKLGAEPGSIYFPPLPPPPKPREVF